MANKTVFFVLAFGCRVLVCQTPITLGNSNMPGNNDTLRYTNVLVSSITNYTQTGTNFNWNFTNVTSLNEGVRSFKSALLTPYAFYFLALNEYGEKIADSLGVGPAVMTNYYNFYKKQSNPPAFVADGVGLTYQNLPIPAYYTDKDELYHFPMTYPKKDSSTFRFSVAPAMLPMKYTRTGYRVTVVDGWGTITTPNGTANCLRLITTQYGIDSVKVGFFGIGVPSVQRSYQWLTSASKIPFFEISGNLLFGNFTPTLARYRGYNQLSPTGVGEPEQIADVSVFPNPVKDRLYVNCTKTTVDFSIFDMTGRLVLSGYAGRDNSIMVQELPAGAYILQVNADNRVTHSRFLKE